MDQRSCKSPSEDVQVRKGPWTMEEDLILINYIANHGEGVWNSLAKAAGLNRTGKSCRLRWLNYLRPDVRRGNITPEEQLLIMELHAKWGNRWSKIAKHLPGRTDNEIKNYWRTRIQKHMKQTTHQNNNRQNYTSSSESNNQATSSQFSNINSNTTSSDTIEITTHSPPVLSFQPTNYIDAYPTPALPPPIDQSYAHHFNNNWNVEDLWSMQLLNEDLSKYLH